MVKAKLTEIQLFQFILVQVGPPPDLGIDDVGESLSGGHLKPAIKGLWYGHTCSGGGPIGGYGCYEGVQFISFFFLKDLKKKFLQILALGLQRESYCRVNCMEYFNPFIRCFVCLRVF